MGVYMVFHSAKKIYSVIHYWETLQHLPSDCHSYNGTNDTQTFIQYWETLQNLSFLIVMGLQQTKILQTS